MRIIRHVSAALITASFALAPVAFADEPQDGGRSGFDMLYDRESPVTLQGKIVDVEWIAPRARLHVADDASGKTWVVLGGSPYDLSKEQRDSVRVGEVAVVLAYQTRDRRCAPECSAFGETFTYADGSPLVTPPVKHHR